MTAARRYRTASKEYGIGYTGDTDPSNAVARLEKGINLLVSEVIDLQAAIAMIHDSKMSPQAKQAMVEHFSAQHITAQEAGKLATEAGARRLVFTHLSVVLSSLLIILARRHPGEGHLFPLPWGRPVSASTMVAFADVSKGFGDRKILIDVSFSVAEGEAICILGRSGTGKSVTLKLMIGLLKPDDREIVIEGENIAPMGPKDLLRIRRSVGFVFQSAALFDSFTLRENLALPLQRFDKSKTPAEIEQTVNDTLHAVGLENAQDKMPSELSGGMRKRAGLARALVLKPKLLLVGEPATGLDRITAGEINDLLLQVKTQRHTTLVIVTRDVLPQELPGMALVSYFSPEVNKLAY